MSYESDEKKLKAGMEVVEKLNFLSQFFLNPFLMVSERLRHVKMAKSENLFWVPNSGLCGH